MKETSLNPICLKCNCQMEVVRGAIYRCPKCRDTDFRTVCCDICGSPSLKINYSAYHSNKICSNPACSSHTVDIDQFKDFIDVESKLTAKGHEYDRLCMSAFLVKENIDAGSFSAESGKHEIRDILIRKRLFDFFLKVLAANGYNHKLKRRIMIPNVIKWTGTKRSLAGEIVSYFPARIKTYWEPFLGSGAIMGALLESNVKVERIAASDICQPLITLWREIRNDPDKLAGEYEKHWNKLKDNLNYFYEVRERFNQDKTDAGAFLFLTRTCVNGLTRFNGKGDFNSSLHITRKGISPDKLSVILRDWSKRVQDVEFKVQDYTEIKPEKDDFCFFDPPYFNTKGMYYGNLDIESFFLFLKELKCGYALTFDGKRDGELQYKLDESLYTRHFYLNESLGGFDKLNGNRVKVQESLYLKRGE